MEPPSPQLGPYVLTKYLGQGTTGKVKLAINTENQQQVAIKIISKESFQERPNLQSKIQREIALMRLVDHPHLLKLVDVLESPRHLYIVLEYAESGELFDYLVQRNSLDPDTAMGFFRQIIYGLEYLHSLGICHRDLKPENILLDSNLNVKIADFGFARFVKSHIAETACGSPHYAAPEVIKGQQYDGRSADVWSCGVILYALLAGYLPFDDPSIRSLLAKVKRGIYQMPPFPEDCKDLISRILVLDPSKRLTISQIKSHPCFHRNISYEYIFPKPLPLPSFKNPIDPSTVSPEILNFLQKIGYCEPQEIAEDFASPQPTMAKVFYFMMTSHATFSQIDWSQSLITKEEPEISDAIMLNTNGSPYSLTDSFSKKFSFGTPAEVSTSLAFRPDWVMASSESLDYIQAYEVNSTLSITNLMLAVQMLMRKLEMQYFHPDDFTLLARQESINLYVFFQASYAPNSTLENPITHLQVQLGSGLGESFAIVCRGIEEIIVSMQNGL